MEKNIMNTTQVEVSVAGPIARPAKRTAPDMTPAQMMTARGLDWSVKKSALYTEVGGKRVSIPGKKALVRMPVTATEKPVVLDTVSPDWHVTQNDEAFNFFNVFVVAGDAEMTDAGEFRGGRKVWASARLKNSFELFGGDVVESNLLFMNPHQYGLARVVFFSPKRISCENSLEFAIYTAEVKARSDHRKAFDPEQAKQILAVGQKYMDDYKEKAAFLGAKRYTPEQVVEFFKSVYPASTPAKRESGELSKAAQVFLDVLPTQPGAKFAEGSWWQALNAVTYAVDHVLGKTDEVRREAGWFGGMAARKRHALELAVDYAKAA